MIPGPRVLSRGASSWQAELILFVSLRRDHPLDDTSVTQLWRKDFDTPQTFIMDGKPCLTPTSWLADKSKFNRLNFRR